MLRDCQHCAGKHPLRYLIKSNNTRALFFLCPKLKGSGESFVVFVPMIDKLNIPSYISGTETYEKLKASVQSDGEFDDEDRKVIEHWRRAALLPHQMTRYQLELIRSYCKGKIHW